MHINAKSIRERPATKWSRAALAIVHHCVLMAGADNHQDDPNRIGSHHAPTKAWCESTMTRVKEIRALADWAVDVEQPGRPEWDDAAAQIFRNSINEHLEDAETATVYEPDKWRWWRSRHTEARLEKAKSSLDAAEADLIRLAPADFVVGQLPSILNHVGRHMQATDPRRVELERIAQRIGAVVPTDDQRYAERNRIVNDERGVIVGAVRGASSVALREQRRLGSFRDAVIATTVAMFLVAAGIVILGFRSPTTVPLCFAPEEADEVTIVCPTDQSGPIELGDDGMVTATEIDERIESTAKGIDTFVVALLGVAAAAVAAASAIRKLRGTSEPFGVPVALAVLKLPTGAVTAVLGLVLMRGGFVPGLSALDTSAQILAWAVIFGYAQQLFTRFADQQAHAVLSRVRGGDKATEPLRSE